MDRSLKASAEIIINATAEEVWDALVNPEKIKVYLFGTETITDWKVGSPIIFQGVYDGYKYQDKGNVLENVPNQFLKYAYWAQYSGLEDKEENYSHVSLSIKSLSPNQQQLSWLQEGFSKPEMQDHTQKGLPDILNSIKDLVEKT
ncbi:MAG: SRPBCC domain-containing protein [Flavobacteriales bacterium]|jgi:uncharacterized protein YndB with AHSA1/START domain|nr:SRPBCC domain-containing protein [Flavobacteriales bacterium]